MGVCRSTHFYKTEGTKKVCMYCGHVEGEPEHDPNVVTEEDYAWMDDLKFMPPAPGGVFANLGVDFFRFPIDMERLYNVGMTEDGYAVIFPIGKHLN